MHWPAHTKWVVVYLHAPRKIYIGRVYLDLLRGLLRPTKKKSTIMYGFFLNIYIYVATESNSFWTWGGQSSQWKYRNWTRQQAFKFGPEQVSFIIKIYSTAWYMCFKKNKLEWRCVCGRDGGGGGGARWSADEGGNLLNAPHKMHLLLTPAIKKLYNSKQEDRIRWMYEQIKKNEKKKNNWQQSVLVVNSLKFHLASLKI